MASQKMNLSASLRFGRATKILLAVLLALVLTWLFFHHAIDRILTAHLLLSSQTPREELFDEIVNQAQDPSRFLNECWSTGKVPHRRLVAGFLKNHAAARPQWLARSAPLLLACAIDADASVRELGMAALDESHSPHLFEAARMQLDNLDPMVRHLGLDYLRKSDPVSAAPLLIRALDDPDLKNVASAENALMRLSGQDFGVRAIQAIEAQDGSDPSKGDSAKVEAIRRGVQKRKLWWAAHQKEYLSNSRAPASHFQDPFPADARPAAPDFTLRDLTGKSVSLSDFKGKVVLVNFWATWCTACLKEIPDLIALQEKMGNTVAIVGVALDGVPDEDGDVPGEANGKPQKDEVTARTKVERAVKLRQINYPVLLDPSGRVGGQYNGGELPTTVLFDAQGRVRRRFIGERTLAVFQAMIAEAGSPPAVTHSRPSAGSD